MFYLPLNCFQIFDWVPTPVDPTTLDKPQYSKMTPKLKVSNCPDRYTLPKTRKFYLYSEAIYQSALLCEKKVQSDVAG